MYYKIPYIPEMKELDLSISLYPVTGETTLYVNPNTKPLELEKYLYQAKGKLSKRITVSWDELVEMKTQGKDLFVAVQLQNQGEYLIKIDAHESHYRGRLSTGYAESGFVKAKDLAKYIVNLKVWENQSVKFTVKMSVFSGKADIHVKQCKKEKFCDFKLEELDSQSQITNNNNEFEKTLTSSCRANDCNFLIIVVGQENHGTHYEIVIQEEKFHYLMLPGHSINVQLNSEENKYLKFSYPANSGQKLFLQVHPQWGSFELYIHTEEKYPSVEKNKFNYSFKAEQNSLLNQNINLNMDDAMSYYNGLIYLSIHATTSCKMDLKFYVDKDEGIALHTLIAGKLETGHINSAKGIQYYQINLSLEETKAQSVSIDLIPQKGNFYLVASRNNRMPSLESNDLMSKDNHLDLMYQNYDQQHEYIIAVIPVISNEDEFEDFKYKIGLSYSEKTTKMQPGVIINHTLNEKNIYQIQMLKEMDNFLILKSIVDGYNINICGVFSSNSNVHFSECNIESDDNHMGLYLNKEEIQKYCSQIWLKNEECYLDMEVRGMVDQLFSIGYTYNDYPFQLVQNNIITGPGILKNDRTINFIYHPTKEGTQIYFNSKGKKMKILTKIINAKKIEGALKFPNQADYDTDNIIHQSFISMAIYSEEQITAQGENAEILISIQPELNDSNSKNNENSYDLINGFILQCYTSAIEILRTHIQHVYMMEQEEKFFYFYNNGNSGQLNVYVNSNVASFIEIKIAKGKGMRPGLDSKPLKIEKGVNQIVLSLTKEDLDAEIIKGYFTISINTKKNCYLNIYWNNKPDFNFIELNTNFPQTVHIIPNKPLYFTFYVSERGMLSRKKDGVIALHYKADGDISIYLKKIQDKDLVIPNEENKNFTGYLGQKGGIGYINIQPENENYCTECSYVGSVTSSLDGQITLLATVDHIDHPINIVSGFTFPDTLLSHKGKTYRFINLHADPFFLNISMLSGQCNVFVDIIPEVNPNNAKEYFFLTQNNQTHSYIKIDPKKYDDKKEFFIRVENPKLDPVTYTLSIFQNEVHSPIEIGISKFIEVGPKESMNLFFEQKQEDKEYEIRFILKSVQPDDLNLNPKKILDNVERLFKVGYQSYNGFQELSQKYLLVEQNRVYIEFESSQSINSKFTIMIDNPYEFSYQVQIDVMSGKYKLLNLNDTLVDSLMGQERLIYETYGMKGRFWFFEMKMCYGETDVQFYKDLRSLQDKQQSLERKTVSENNTFVYYFAIEDYHVYVDISNKNSEKSIFKITAYNEQDLNDNPYQEVVALNDGQVKVDTSANKISFEPLSIKNFNDDAFDHKIIYTLYLSPNFKEMRFTKNCGRHLVEKAFSSNEILSQVKELIFSGSKEFNAAKRVEIELPSLDKSKRYYGVVIAEIHLLTRGEGMIEPLRQSMTYYDEFIIVSGKAEVKIDFWVPIIGIMGIIGILYYFINDYIFGDINRFKDITNDMKNLGESNINVFDILESDYKFEEEPEKKQPQSKPKQKSQVEIEMKEQDDRKAPLDIDD